MKPCWTYIFSKIVTNGCRRPVKESTYKTNIEISFDLWFINTKTVSSRPQKRPKSETYRSFCCIKTMQVGVSGPDKETSHGVNNLVQTNTLKIGKSNLYSMNPRIFHVNQVYLVINIYSNWSRTFQIFKVFRFHLKDRTQLDSSNIDSDCLKGLFSSKKTYQSRLECRGKYWLTSAFRRFSRWICTETNTTQYLAPLINLLYVLIGSCQNMYEDKCPAQSAGRWSLL